LVAAELHRYNVNIAALSETSLADEGSLSAQLPSYTWHWLCNTYLSSHRLPETPVAIDERLMTLRIPLAKGHYMTVLSAYAPTVDVG